MLRTLLAAAFRPFFLLAALAGLILPLAWLAVLVQGRALVGGLPAVAWHVHELLVGMVGAVLAGFVLTAAQVWTKRRTVTGPALGALALAWLAGRGVMAWPGLPPGVVVLPDALWLTGAALAVARPVVLARSWRNLGFPFMLLGLAAAHGVMVLAPAWGPRAWRVALDIVLVAMVLVSGRVVPMFTRNGLGDPGVDRWPRADGLALGGSLLVLVAHGLALERLAGLSCAFTALALVARQVPWRPQRTLRAPLLWVLHLGHAWLPAGLALLAAHHLGAPISASVGVHALTAGAMMTLCAGMVARVSLGHTGRPLVVGPGVALAFGAVGLAGALRVLTGVFGLGVLGWGAAAALLAATWGALLWQGLPLWTRPRPDGRPG